LTASVQRGVADIASSVPAAIVGEPRERPLDHPALLWTAVARCLVRGDPDPSVRRPGLPAELVLPISKLCGFVRPSSRPIRWAEPPKPLRIQSHGPLQRERWATSEPLTAEMIASLAALRVVTVSANQGWVSHPAQGTQWSSFELVVLRAGEEVARAFSHANPTAARPELYFGPWAWRSPIADRSGPSRVRHGPVQDESLSEGIALERLLASIEPGDQLALFACARFPGWANRGDTARFETQVWFVPSLELLLLPSDPAAVH